MSDVAFLTHLCQLAAPALREGFHGAKNISYKAPNQILTDSDIRVNELICSSLVEAGISPSQIISEESSTSGTDLHKELWCIDPIDGTKEFASGIPEFALSIGIVKEGKFCGGAIFNPMDPLLVVGTLEEGLFVNEKKFHPQSYPSDKTPFEVLCSRSEFNKGVVSGFEKTFPVKPLGSVAYKLALVASGRAGATLSYRPKNVWDVAAGFGLVSIAGGAARDLDGLGFSYSATHPLYRRGLLAVAPGTTWADRERLFSAFNHGFTA